MNRFLFLFAAPLALLACGALPSSADSFGSGVNSFTIDFVTVGSPGNPPDVPPNPAGAVPYLYRIAKYEISEQMVDKANALGGLGITKDTRGPGKPATSITWFEAAMFVNWLNTSTGHSPAYKFDASGDFQLWQPSDAGYDATNLFRNKLAVYVLPSTNEWHKAAYYDPAAGHYWDYPTGSDSVPDGIDFAGDTVFEAVFYDGGANSGPNDVAKVGLPSPFGAFGLGGNAVEWHETAFDRLNSGASEQRSTSVGGWASPSTGLIATNSGIGVAPAVDFAFQGFRVAIIVPEPKSVALGVVAACVSFMFRPHKIR